MTKISWYNFTHPNKEAIQKRDKFLEEPTNYILRNFIKEKILNKL